ncbi:hypothetical protein ABEB36_015802 [Hypothenemus hampei]|uniref:Uncharacterized protein n=1 Tax=Hypothenemus hampei TaxID=57062 RepID=A0ABD1E0L5_HYPHA
MKTNEYSTRMETTAMGKGPYHFILADEISKSSDTESQCSLQDKETDFVIDTSDTESDSDFRNSRNNVVLEEYDVSSQSDTSISPISNASSDITLRNHSMTLTTLNVIDNADNYVTITDIEESEHFSDDTHLSHKLKTYNKCLRCKKRNNSLFSYCGKCFQDRKKEILPRPKKKQINLKLDIKNVLNNLGQDSKVKYTQDKPGLDIDQIVDFGLQVSDPTETKELESYSPESSLSKKEDNISRVKYLKRKRSSSENTGLSKSDKKVRLSNEAHFNIDLKISPRPFTSTQRLSLCSENKDICIICYNGSKDCVFLHTYLAHCCCCYACGKKIFKINKRCPLCNKIVNKVLKIFY